MLETKQVSVIFADARVHYAQALDQLEQGQLQKAAGKAWDATLKATDGLILARTGREPGDDQQTFTEILTLGLADPDLKDMGYCYGILCGTLFEGCVCDGICEPVEVMCVDIQCVLDYIQTAETLAGR